MENIKEKSRRRVGLFIIILLFLGAFFSFRFPVQAQGSQVINLPKNCSVEEIQKALDKNASNASKHLTVNIPAGKYTLKRTLFVSSNTTVHADKNAVFRLSSKDGYKTLIGSYNFSGDKGGYHHIQNVTIEGGVWDGNYISGEYIRFIHGKNITIRNVAVKNGGNGAHLITLAGVKDGLIEKCVLTGYSGKDAKEAIHLDIVHDQSMVPGTDRYDDTTNQNIVIRNNTVKNYSRAVGSHSAVDGVFQKNVTITGNTFTNLREEAVKLYGFVNTKVTKNKIDGAKIGIRVYTYLSGASYKKALSGTKKEKLPSNYKIVISKNEIKNSKQYGIQMNGTKKRPLKGVIVSENKISVTKDSGIMIYQYCTKNIIKSNTITKAGNQGIGLYKASNSNQVLDNKIIQAKNYGIYIGEALNNKIKSNGINKSGKHGIWINDGSHKTQLLSNRVTTPGDFGIGLRKCKSVIVKSNKITASKEIALYMKGCKNAIKSGNQYVKVSGKKEVIS